MTLRMLVKVNRPNSVELMPAYAASRNKNTIHEMPVSILEFCNYSHSAFMVFESLSQQRAVVFTHIIT
jgi:hypothetical protein